MIQSFWMLLASFMFALMAAGIKYATEMGASLSLIVLSRGVPSVVVIMVWALLTHHSLKARNLRVHIMRNLFGVSAMWMSFYCYSVLPLSTSTCLSYTSSIFIGAWVLIAGKKSSRDYFRLFKVIFGFAGVLLVLQPSVNEDQWFACAIGLMSGAFAGVAMLQIRSLGVLGEPVWRTVFYFSTVVCISGVLSLNGQGIGQPNISAWICLVLVGLTGLFGQLALTQAYGEGSTMLTAVLQYSTIIFALLIGIVVWRDIPDSLAWFGMLAVVLAGIMSAWQTMVTVNRSKKIKETQA